MIKFYYQNTLCGDFALNRFSLTDDNSSSATNILKSRFGRSDSIINAHMLKLFNIGCVLISCNVSALRKMNDEI